VSSGNFTGRGGAQFVHGGYRGDHDRHHGHCRGFGFAAGLAAGKKSREASPVRPVLERLNKT